LDKLQALWEYQAAEIELEEYENVLKNTETRKKLVQHQKYLQARQQAIKNIEMETTMNQNRITEISAQIEVLSAKMEQKNQELSEMADYDLEDLFIEDVRESIKESENIKSALEQNKRKIVEIRKKLEKAGEEIMQTLRNMSAVKKEFDRLKELHNEEIEKGSGEVTRLKAQLELAAQKVDPELMEKYKKIKQRRPNPVARLNNGRCSGCNMQLPSSVIGSLKINGNIVECDSCGRIIYI
jgi:predicted  nucleic acid-binding Zn-ribbon protein